ncbi:IclR family transcriptional regulator C-terminal domain-containing protein [Streptomyces sp. NPDC059679]|uniref:IclR family transcriptional regulator domain-containing protein n=1 Tax=Streptomyces sp. NPDC059679 TaxID=3346903 RepID=UPI00367CD292
MAAHNWLDRHLPLYATVGGKILLAHLPEAEVESRFVGSLPRYTPRTVTDLDGLRAQLNEVRADGCRWCGRRPSRSPLGSATPALLQDGTTGDAVGFS